MVLSITFFYMKKTVAGRQVFTNYKQNSIVPFNETCNFRTEINNTYFESGTHRHRVLQTVNVMWHHFL